MEEGKKPNVVRRGGIAIDPDWRVNTAKRRVARAYADFHAKPLYVCRDCGLKFMDNHVYRQHRYAYECRLSPADKRKPAKPKQLTLFEEEKK